MDPKYRGFNQNVAVLASCENREQVRNAFRDAVSSFADRLREEDEKIAEEDSAESVTSDDRWVPNAVDFSRRVMLHTNQPMDIERIDLLNEIYAVEGDALNQAHRITLETMSQQDDKDSIKAVLSGTELVQRFQGLHGKILRTTDRLTRSGGLTDMGIDEYSRMTLFARHLLYDFYKICPAPNLAELLMLARACRLPLGLIMQWFWTRESEDKKLFDVMASARNKGWIGELCRKQRELDANHTTLPLS